MTTRELPLEEAVELVLNDAPDSGAAEAVIDLLGIGAIVMTTDETHGYEIRLTEKGVNVTAAVLAAATANGFVQLGGT